MKRNLRQLQNLRQILQACKDGSPLIFHHFYEDDNGPLISVLGTSQKQG